ncbi:MAG: hypothetical protein ACPLRW_04835 [Moorellales bacterium]
MRTAAGLALLVLFAAGFVLAPLSASAATAPDPDRILDEVSQGRARPVTLDEAAAKATEIAVRLIKVIQRVALPIAMVIFLIGVIVMGIGWGTGNVNLRRTGGGAALGALGAYVLVRLAPIIFGTVVEIVK